MGKYLAAVGVFVITLLITVLFPVIMSFFALLGLAWWEILGGYIGFFLLGCAFIAVGLFFSSLTDNQLIAAVVHLRRAAADLDPGLHRAERALGRRLGARVPCVFWAPALVVLVFFSTRNIAGGRRDIRAWPRPPWCSCSSSRGRSSTG